jgi:hypothetical protein
VNEEVTTSSTPRDRLTRLCKEMTTVLDKPENSDVRAIVMLNTDERGGIQLHGYEDQTKAMAEMFIHLQAIFRSVGKELTFIGIPESPGDLP